MHKTLPKSFLTEKELATYLGVSISWVRKCRYTDEGVKFKKFGRSVRYHVDDVLAYTSVNNSEVN